MVMLYFLMWPFLWCLAAVATMDDALYASCRGLTCTFVDACGSARHVVPERYGHEAIQTIRKRSQTIADSDAVGRRCEEYAQSVQTVDGKRRRCWFSRFVELESRVNKIETVRFKAAAARIRRYWNKYLARKRGEIPVAEQRATNGLEKTGARHRRRVTGGGRKPLAPALRQGLFEWFVDSLQNVRGRIASFLILAQASVIKQDLAEFYKQEVAGGRIQEGATPRLPQLNANWLRRWRIEYGLSWRTVNLRFKCSWGVMKRRLRRLFWGVLQW